VLKNILFWQPKKDYLRFLINYSFGHQLILIINYSLWPFLFLVCYILIKTDFNVFWQIATATILTEIFEKISKKSFFWKRPLYAKKDSLPTGLHKAWYTGGSFPSGHCTRAIYFLLLITQYGHFSPILYIAFILPLLVFRVIIGFHYPIDMLGGVVVGFVAWLATHNLVFPDILVNLIKNIFTWLKI